MGAATTLQSRRTRARRRYRRLDVSREPWVVSVSGPSLLPLHLVGNAYCSEEFHVACFASCRVILE